MRSIPQSCAVYALIELIVLDYKFSFRYKHVAEQQ